MFLIVANQAASNPPKGRPILGASRKEDAKISNLADAIKSTLSVDAPEFVPRFSAPSSLPQVSVINLKLKHINMPCRWLKNLVCDLPRNIILCQPNNQC